jgi:hypothetical protein
MDGDTEDTVSRRLGRQERRPGMVAVSCTPVPEAGMMIAWWAVVVEDDGIRSDSVTSQVRFLCVHLVTQQRLSAQRIKPIVPPCHRLQ